MSLQARQKLKDIIKFFKPQTTSTFDEEIIKLKPQKTAETFSKIPIKGLIPGMAIHYAGCCHPVLGDNIIGVVNTGKGLTIHTNDCHQLALIPSESGFLDLSWNEDNNEDIFVGRLKIIFTNKQGALASITSAISKCGADINNLKIIHRSIDIWEIITDIGVHDKDQLQNIQASLRTLSLVSQVDRQ